MVSEDKAVEERKNKIKKWIYNRNNLIFIGIFILALVLRLYYFSLTKTQPLWWDESDYLAYAKNIAGFNVPWIVTEQHNSIFPFVVAVFFKLGLSEAITKFFLEILPSIILVYLAYVVANLMYKDKKIALICSFLMATFWEILFNSTRFHLEIPGLFFGFLAVYVFWKGYEKREKIFGKISSNWAVPIAVIFVVLTYMTRRGYFVFGFFFLVYMLITRKFSELVKDKYNWIGLAIAIILLIFSESFIFTAGITDVAGAYYHPENKISLVPFDVFPAYFNTLSGNWNILLYLFWIGFIVMIGKIFLYIGHYKESSESDVKSDLFLILSIIITLAYFIFFQRAPDFGEPRWYFPLLFASFVCVSRGTLLITDYISKYYKPIGVILLILLIGFGGYYQYQHADFIIKNKIESFSGIRDASLLIKEISQETDIIMDIPTPQTEYYAERKSYNPNEIAGTPTNKGLKLEEVLPKLEENKNIRYVIVTFSEPGHPDWMQQVQYVQDANGNVRLGKWLIPFMDTEIDFTTGQQKFIPSKKYGNIEFRFLSLKGDAFVYEIVHLN